MDSSNVVLRRVFEAVDCGGVEERHDIRHYLQVEVQPKVTESEAINPQSNYSKCFDDDGRLKRTGSYTYPI
ncbi:hypothetical protein ACE6H2_027727 [Prunus campanulata]